MQGRRPRGTEQDGTCEGGEGEGREGEPEGLSGAGSAPPSPRQFFQAASQDKRAHASSGARLGARGGGARSNGRGRGAPGRDGGARAGERLQAERYSHTAGDATGPLRRPVARGGGAPGGDFNPWKIQDPDSRRSKRALSRQAAQIPRGPSSQQAQLTEREILLLLGHSYLCFPFFSLFCLFNVF